MATVLSTRSGNWTDPATWAGGVVPVAADDITIAAGHTVTLDADFTVAGSLSLAGTLSVSAGVCLFMGTPSVVSEDGLMNLVGGGRLNGAGTFTPVRGKFSCTATVENWAFIEGELNIGLGSLTITPCGPVEYDCVRLSVGNTGERTFLSCGGSPGRGGYTGHFRFPHCVFIGGPTSFGIGGWTKAGDFDFSHSQFEEPREVAFRSVNSAGTTSLRNLSGCVFYAADSLQTITLGADGPWRFDGTVLINCGLHSGYGNRSLQGKNMFISLNAKQGYLVYTTAPDSEVRDSYIYTPADGPAARNPHIIGVASLLNGVIECGAAQEPNHHLGNVPEMLTQGVLCLGCGDLANRVGDVNQNWTVRNCTRVSPAASVVNSVWLSENGTLTGTLKLRNNLHVCLGDAPDSHQARTVGVTQAIDFDYCVQWNVKEYLEAGAFVNASDLAHCFEADPRFVDPTRGLVAWLEREAGIAGATYLDAYALFRNALGYDEGMKTLHPERASAYSPADLAAWVRAGFAPRNAALATAGEGGTYIGAMPVNGQAVEPLPPAPGADAGPLTFTRLRFG